METIMMAINESWIWLGPLLIITLGMGLIGLIADLIRTEYKGWQL
ncbi:MAG TPA: hypothetical protein VMW42_08555 [Desulfatiglandales bacterium]|nr:hypothetical protein [Desulfatiglandales bacterium]